MAVPEGIHQGLGPAAVTAAGGAWAQRRDQMILPAARIVTPGGVQGSGFVLYTGPNGTFVITNHHVIQDCILQEDRWDSVSKSSKKVERLLPVSVEIFRYDERGRHLQTVTTAAEVVAYTAYGDRWNFEGDLALLKLRAPVDGVPAARIIGAEEFLLEVRMLDEVIMVGCPDGSEMPLPTTGHVASLTEERAGVGLLLSQVFGNPGSSGSGVYRYSWERDTYEVVAVHSMVDSRGSLTDVGRGSFLRLAVPAPELHEFLRRHDFAHLVEGPKQEVLESEVEVEEQGEGDGVEPDEELAASDTNLQDLDPQSVQDADPQDVDPQDVDPQGADPPADDTSLPGGDDAGAEPPADTSSADGGPDKPDVPAAGTS